MNLFWLTLIAPIGAFAIVAFLLLWIRFVERPDADGKRRPKG
jgi:hypothetical protein